jgi:hypothetical protein
MPPEQQSVPPREASEDDPSRERSSHARTSTSAGAKAGLAAGLRHGRAIRHVRNPRHRGRRRRSRAPSSPREGGAYRRRPGCSSSEEGRIAAQRSLARESVEAASFPIGCGPAGGPPPHGSGEQHLIPNLPRPAAVKLIPSPDTSQLLGSGPSRLQWLRTSWRIICPAGCPRRAGTCWAVRRERSVPRDTDSKPANSTSPSASPDSIDQVYGDAAPPGAAWRVRQSAQSNAGSAMWRILGAKRKRCHTYDR